MTLDPVVPTITEEDRRLIGLWAAECAEHVLLGFESQAPIDPRPRQAIEGIRAFAHGQIRKGPLRPLIRGAYAAAREVGDPAAKAAARAAGGAASSAYIHDRVTLSQAKHALGSAAYAVYAHQLAAPNDPTAADEAIRRAISRASLAVRDLVRQMPIRNPTPGRLNSIFYRLDAEFRR